MIASARKLGTPKQLTLRECISRASEFVMFGDPSYRFIKKPIRGGTALDQVNSDPMPFLCGWLDGTASISVPNEYLHQSDDRPQDHSSERLQFELHLAQACRWKRNSVHLVQKNRSARQCLCALSINSTKNNKYNKTNLHLKFG